MGYAFPSPSGYPHKLRGAITRKARNAIKPLDHKRLVHYMFDTNVSAYILSLGRR